MKILHIIPSLGKGGAEKMVLDICEEFSKRPNVEVKLLVLSHTNTFDLESYNFEIKFMDVDYSFSFFKSNGSPEEIKYFEFIEDFSPKVIHSHLFETEVLPRTRRLKGAKYFSHAHCNTIELTKPSIKNFTSKKGLIDFLVYKKLVNVYKKVNNSFITISNDADKFYRKNIPQFKNRTHLVTNAIKVSRYQSPLRTKSDKLKLISIGSLIERKNQSFQVDIAKKLKELNINFELNILGGGIEMDNLKSKIDQLGLTNHVNLIGISNEIPSLLQENFIFLHTAKYEPFGLVLVEAMASGLPIIALDGGGNEELVQDGKTGYFLKEENEELFVNKILDLWNNEKKYQFVSKNAFEKAKKYDIGPYVTKLLDLYKN